MALGLVILGVLPEQEAALYFLAVALLLLLPALLLLMAIFHVGSPRSECQLTGRGLPSRSRRQTSMAGAREMVDTALRRRA